MKTPLLITIVCFLSLSLLSYSSKFKGNNNTIIELKDSANLYKDGTYQGHSQSYYTSEPFWGHLQIKVKNGTFTEITFAIRDSSSHEAVDSMYGVHHYAGIPEYQQQCVNDGHGIETYPERLLNSQDIENVDAITGATWSYNIFISTVKNALKDAIKTSSVINQSENNNVIIEAFPNPFNATILLKYTLGKNYNISIDIFDTQGKLVSKLVRDNFFPGEYSVQWKNTIPGTYIYRLKANDIVLSGRIIQSK
jgi:major membrane immunogen (membrane-anchored lipoprotein)